ncbi:LamB/YcsF family protein [Schumannella sp. 10F1B-5-1]|uniref:LamB/YcsF family protein n=1 Tax=Schumannella sp. 10F1B-5-1 TaxID=2590780 RepID=UPI00112FE0E1|nr:5-oxoprolinase subunit PxpA [Schumannella sp. 10F1B-5-1]TPW78278.1 LamB/YcsF family protein [Schumannella sp. 10F1B-5-1]
MPAAASSTASTAPARSISLNADVGEGFGTWTFGDDDALLARISDANVACGFHGGDPGTMRRVTAAAAASGIGIGAHVSYRDLAGFGRRPMTVSPPELRDDVVAQIGALQAFARLAGAEVGYVKPHGALYNTIAVDEVQARAVIEAVAEALPGARLLCQPGTVVARLATEAGIPVVAEVFADRGYLADGRLAPRREPGSLFTDPELIAARVRRMVVSGEVEAVDGTVHVFAAPPQSVCVHSDTPGAGEIAGVVRSALEAAGMRVDSLLRR